MNWLLGELIHFPWNHWLPVAFHLEVGPWGIFTIHIGMLLYRSCLNNHTVEISLCFRFSIRDNNFYESSFLMVLFGESQYFISKSWIWLFFFLILLPEIILADSYKLFLRSYFSYRVKVGLYSFPTMWEQEKRDGMICQWKEMPIIPREIQLLEFERLSESILQLQS